MLVKMLAIAAVAGGIPTVQANPLANPRIASINVCTDQLLMALADPEQIVGLSPYARDPASSWAAQQAEKFPRLSGEAEDVLMLRPDVVVASLFTRQATLDMLKQQGLRVIEFNVAGSLDDAKSNILRMGEIVGKPERARAEILRLDSAVARLKQFATQHSLRVLAVSRRGWITGQNSLLGAMLHAAGLVNAAQELGVGEGGMQSLETIIRLRPDILVVSDDSATATDQGQAFLLHPALERLYPQAKRIVITDRLTVCDGPMLAEAAERLAAGLEQVVRPR